MSGDEKVLSGVDKADTRTAALPSQADVLQWARDRWPDRCTPIWRAAKLAEEAGEVMGAVIKSGEDPPRKSEADIAQETAQLVICAMGLAESVGFDLFAEVAKEYERCTS